MGRSVYPSPGSEKPVQRGIANIGSNTAATATIAAVNPAKSKLRFLGSNGVSTVNMTLTNATTITFNNAGSPAGANVSWELSERY